MLACIAIISLFLGYLIHFVRCGGPNVLIKDKTDLLKDFIDSAVFDVQKTAMMWCWHPFSCRYCVDFKYLSFLIFEIWNNQVKSKKITVISMDSSATVNHGHL